ncbi:type 1 glutamine amidotransferase-like domain-containing protein [Bacillus sp. SB49]|uniref:Type 1 glutamine amidotransferase-like domain-containing protein n=1 Tax=Bacillus sp. SB49 TaxID=1071080 RepID=UPI00040C534C|nr:Type 1 glutamine amidotransferase-like domain-containing protein [Bacillus sp. SB49]QHT47924.1 type 1 glutamine amidotransferase-like domain-containing protein [Bacillus sp. SB49]
MGSLILSGGGSYEQNLDVYQFLVNKVDADKPILYIPLAGDAEHRSYQRSFDYIKSILMPLGVKEFVMWTDLADKKREDLTRFSAVYFSGGRSVTLLEVLKKSGFDEVIRQYYNDGGIIFGQSAGAILFGSDISYTTKQRQTNQYRPLQLLHGTRLWCHYVKEDDEFIYHHLNKENIPFIALADGGAIHVTKRRIEVIAEDVYEMRNNRDGRCKNQLRRGQPLKN